MILTTFAIVIITICVFIGVIYMRFLNKEAEDSRKKLYIDKIVGLATIFAGISSLIVGIVSISIMYSQSDMQKKLIMFQQMEHQPNFEVITTVNNHSYNGNTFSTEYFSIMNIGEKFKRIAVEDKSFFKIDYTLNYYGNGEEERIISYMPVRYFEHIKYTGHLNGEVARSFQYISNNSEQYYRLLQSVSEYNHTNQTNRINIERVDFFIIQYEDIYGEERTVYLQNNLLVNESYYYEIVNQSQNDYCLSAYDITGITIDDFFRDCKSLGIIKKE